MGCKNWCQINLTGQIMVDKLAAIIFLVVMVASASHPTFAQTVVTIDDVVRYEFHGERVYDKQTNLSWMRCSVGQQWRAPDRCIGKPKGFTFREAQRVPKEGVVWRIPSPFEFSTLFRGQLGIPPTNETRGMPKINTQAFPDMDPSRLLYWTNEAMSSTNAWFADFNNGDVDFVYGDYGFLHQKFAVRLVHTGNYGDGG